MKVLNIQDLDGLVIRQQGISNIVTPVLTTNHDAIAPLASEQEHLTSSNQQPPLHAQHSHPTSYTAPTPGVSNLDILFICETWLGTDYDETSVSEFLPPGYSS